MLTKKLDVLNNLLEKIMNSNTSTQALLPMISEFKELVSCNSVTIFVFDKKAIPFESAQSKYFI
jgi:hypothetical protein